MRHHQQQRRRWCFGDRACLELRCCAHGRSFVRRCFSIYTATAVVGAFFGGRCLPVMFLQKLYWWPSRRPPCRVRIRALDIYSDVRSQSSRYIHAWSAYWGDLERLGHRLGDSKSMEEAACRRRFVLVTSSPGNTAPPPLPLALQPCVLQH